MSIRRRDILGMAGALAPALAAPESPPVVKPRALKPGDTVGLITPASYVSDPDTLAGVARTIEYFELKSKWGRNVGRKLGYLGGTIAERVADLHAMFSDPEVKAVIPIRGGYGSGQLLDAIDYDLI